MRHNKNNIDMKVNHRTVFIVDDDPSVGDALRCLFESVNFQVETYQSAFSFLNQKYDAYTQGCLIVDVRMPTMSGLELLTHLQAQKSRLPVIMMTAYGDIQMVIRAMKLGAFDFVLKPFNDQSLLEIVQKCMTTPFNRTKMDDVGDRMNLLTEREREVIDLIVEGKLTKEIAYGLSVSISTVEAHRASIMRKMKAKNLAQLVKIYIQARLDVDYS